ncbi:MAG: Ig-like domain-containing protein [Nitrospirae bacterium]|nr:Ig-like domain-containing protein [Nitrospirota bacterium]
MHTLQLRAFGLYTDDTWKEITAKVTWACSDPTVATITQGGLATAIAKGTTQISATYQSITGSSILTVNPPPMYIFITPSRPIPKTLLSNLEQ